MRRLAIFVVLAACGGKPAPAPATTPPPTAPKEAPPPEDNGTAAPALNPKQAAVYARLRDDGPVPGVPGVVQRRTPSARHCGGERVGVTLGGGKLGPDEEAVAALYRIEFPTGLDFSPEPEHQARKEASLKKFQDWLASTMKTGEAGTRLFTGKLSAAASDVEKAEYAARIGQITARVASLLLRAEISKDIRTGEFAADKIEAFCDQMVTVGEPLVARAAEAFARCSAAAAKAPQAWWAKLCSAP